LSISALGRIRMTARICALRRTANDEASAFISKDCTWLIMRVYPGSHRKVSYTYSLLFSLKN